MTEYNKTFQAPRVCALKIPHVVAAEKKGRGKEIRKNYQQNNKIETTQYVFTLIIYFTVEIYQKTELSAK